MTTLNSYFIILGLNFVLMFLFAIISIQFSAKICNKMKQSIILRIIICFIGALFCSFANMSTTIDFFYVLICVLFIIAYLILFGYRQFSLSMYLVNAYMLNIMTLRMCVMCLAAQFSGLSLYEVAYANPELSELCLIITLVLLITAMLIMIRIIPRDLVYRITQLPALRRSMNLWMGLSNIYLLYQSMSFSSPDSSGLTLLHSLILISILLLFANWAFLFYNVKILKLLDYEFENRKMHVQMKELNYAATTDGLTGLLNKVSVIKEINSIISSGGALFVIDIDDFKTVNDTQGHTSGDALLRQVAASIKDHFRSDDILGRFGGDEFISFISGNPLSSDFLEMKAFELCKSTKKLTGTSISIGILVIPSNHFQTFDEAFPLADQALYASKAKSKNTYTIQTL